MRFVQYSDSSRKTYFRCNRSGNFSSESKGKRRLKSQGSSKCGNYCTAGIVLEKVEEDGGYSAKTCLTHYGHSLQMAHIFLPSKDREFVASKLMQGIPVNGVLDQIRDSVTEEYQRVHLLTRKDILNIEQSFGLRSSIERHSNDNLSIKIWAEEQKSIYNSSLIVFKAVGEEGYGLKTEDFALGLMNTAQSEMLVKCGHNGIVCMDATHGTNPLDYKLITILVVDEAHQGYPVAFFYSNKEDEMALTVFLRAVKEKTGIIIPTAFMSDDASQYYKAWETVMGAGSKKLLCSWHVDRAWRGKIKGISSEKQAATYKALKVLQCETNTEDFHKMLLEFLGDPQLADFGLYFEKYYASRPQQWAYCFRLGVGINTNMHLESFHKIIKHVYMGGLKARRLDRSVGVLLKIARDKQFERLIKVEKNVFSTRQKDLDDRHKKSLVLQLENVRESFNRWLISSSTDCCTVYQVSQNKLSEDHSKDCKLICTPCGTCCHAFFCSCIDSSVKGHMCKHIHLVCRFNKKADIPLNLDQENTFCHGISEASEIFKGLPKVLPTTLQKEREGIIELCQSISTMASTLTSVDDLKSAKPMLTAAHQALKMCCTGKNTSSLQELNKEPPNKKMLLQNRFKKSKQKRNKPYSLNKPNFFEIAEVKSHYGLND